MRAPSRARGGPAYAIKILKPASAFARCLPQPALLPGLPVRRSAPRSAPPSVRIGVLWQKLIRRAAALEFGDERGGVRHLRHLLRRRAPQLRRDQRVDRRTHLEVRGRRPAASTAGISTARRRRSTTARSTCTRSSSCGGWSSCCTRWGPASWRASTSGGPARASRTRSSGSAPSDSPDAGLTAVDFRAGLALLPFLPMSPVDFVLDPARAGARPAGAVRPQRHRRLRQFVAARGGFEDLEPAIEELERQDAAYRASLPDLTQHLFRLFVDRRLRGSIRSATITAWRNLGRLDEEHEERLRAGRARFALLFCCRWFRCSDPGSWGSGATRRGARHARRCLTSPGYLCERCAARASRPSSSGRAPGGSLRSGRPRLVGRPFRFWVERIFLGWLPPTWHRFVAEPAWGWGRVRASARYACGSCASRRFARSGCSSRCGWAARSGC